jgi:transcriptional regulator with XRE-family HTH domain
MAAMVRVTRLREWRERRALTQRELAEKAGLTLSTVNELDQGIHDARISTLRKLAKALDVEPEDLIEWAEPAQVEKRGKDAA